MFASILTTIFFSFSAILANRSIAAVGSTRANLGRLVVAFVCLGAMAHGFGGGMGGAGRNGFLLSGVIGMGLGDLALFAALPRLGSRLTVLMCQCVAVPIAMQAEWMWMDTRLAPLQMAWAAVILIGVTVALMPSPRHPPKVPITRVGFLCGFLAAAGQGLGAVLSRHAYQVSAAAGLEVDGITAAYQRITGGLLITGGFFLVRHFLTRETPPTGKCNHNGYTWRGAAFVVGNGLCGPVIGVSCYQWALAGTPSGIVLPIVATTPLVIIPLSYWIEGDRPTARSMVGGLIAVTGVVALTLVG
ncbi:DMT family transporter [Synoicihabitans lomoniglobus]|uniref:DMT family transporter n=1 Tax=Synoicihabitans lomoniglobus TaxID=2909285 RepID=A0AAE9ZYU9_9BACT|nr:DMT family transporter [Opitutaceae bacterium LMO-M01]WED63778.1 DMT family transporter [Opitutaceae bacterium LMO-M01]